MLGKNSSYLTTSDKFLNATRKKAALRARPRGWSLPSQGSCIDPKDQSHPLDPDLKASGLGPGAHLQSDY